MNAVALTRDEVVALGLDGRRRYARVAGQVCRLVTWTQECSGCQAMDGSNFGCRECGYSGKRRSSFWAPIDVYAAGGGA